jgi:hypothetical protein
MRCSLEGHLRTQLGRHLTERLRHAGQRWRSLTRQGFNRQGIRKRNYQTYPMTLPAFNFLYTLLELAPTRNRQDGHHSCMGRIVPMDPLFAPFRALGYITDNVPFAIQRRGQHMAGQPLSAGSPAMQAHASPALVCICTTMRVETQFRPAAVQLKSCLSSSLISSTQRYKESAQRW